MSKKHPMKGSLKTTRGWKHADLAWDAKKSGYFVCNLTSKKRFGPFKGVPAARAFGLKFHADGGARAKAK
jgi:hypothetical protein